MPLTAAETVDVTHHAGFPGAGAPPAALAAALASMTPEAEARVRVRFLPALNAMEAGIAASLELVDTKKAAVFERNEHELRERAAMYHWQRVALCRFLGVEPGPGAVLTDLPPFTPCCPRTASATGGGTTPTDPATGEAYTPAVLVV